MKRLKVADFMIPLHEYSTIAKGSTLYEAVMALEQAQANYYAKAGPGQFPHRAILVLDEDETVIGKISQLDVLRALEPKYRRIITSDALGRLAASGFSADFLKDMIEDLGLFNKPMHDLCQKAAEMKVEDCMYTPGDGENVLEDDTLDVAVHKLVLGHHQSLLVVKNGRITGIIRLIDVFQAISNAMKACKTIHPDHHQGVEDENPSIGCGR